MAISDTEKLDFVWKKVIGGVTKTASALVKFLSNETIPSPSPVLPSNVWKDGDDIPTSPPGSTTGTIALYTGVDAIQMTNDATAPANVAWLACSTYGNAATRMTSFIPATFGSGYSVKVWVGNPNGGPAARIFPDATNEEWVYDYAAGVLVFTGTIPAGKTATVGSGTVSVAANGVYIEAFKYTGATGVGDELPFIPHLLGQLADVEDGTGTPVENSVLTWKDGIWQAEPPRNPSEGLGTMSTQDSNNVNITGGTITGVTLSDYIVDGGSF